MSNTVHLPRPAYSASDDYSRLALFADVAHLIPSTATKAHGYRAIREDGEAAPLLISPSHTVIGHKGEYTKEAASALYDMAAVVTYGDAYKAQSAMSVAEAVATEWEADPDDARQVLLTADRAIRSGVAGLAKPENILAKLTEGESMAEAVTALEEALTVAVRAKNAKAAKKRGGGGRKPADLLEAANAAVQALLDGMTAESDPYIPAEDGLNALIGRFGALSALLKKEEAA